MKKFLASLLLFVFVPFLSAADQKIEAKPVPVPSFLRYETKDGIVQSLQTNIVTYEKDGVQVDLIGAIHIGDRNYYRQLNRHMEGYDALLYELVAPPGKIPDRKNSIFGALVKMGLELDTQVQRIDYSKKNFVHADLSFDEIQKVLDDRGEDLLIVGLRVVSEMMQQKKMALKTAKKNPLAALEAAQAAAELNKAENPLQMKRALARLLTLQVNESQVPTLNRILIKDRNTKAVEVLQQQLTNGKKKLGIFYGAAHLPDFDERLRKLGFKPRKEVMWVTAWDLTDD